jgi:WD40 repeat protein
VTALTASPDGRTLLVGDSYGTLTTWDIDDPKRARRLGGAERHTGSIAHLAYHPDGEIVASMGTEGSVRLWDLSDPSNPRETAALLDAGPYRASGAAFSPDGEMIAVAAGETTQLWDVRIDGILQRLCAESAPVTEDQWTQYLPNRGYDPPCAEPVQLSTEAGSTP